MPQEPRKPIPPPIKPEKTAPEKPKPDQDDPDTERTGPGTGGGRGNDLPSKSETQRDTRSVEGQQSNQSASSGTAVQSENPEA